MIIKLENKNSMINVEIELNEPDRYFLYN